MKGVLYFYVVSGHCKILSFEGHPTPGGSVEDPEKNEGRTRRSHCK